MADPLDSEAKLGCGVSCLVSIPSCLFHSQGLPDLLSTFLSGAQRTFHVAFPFRRVLNSDEMKVSYWLTIHGAELHIVTQCCNWSQSALAIRFMHAYLIQELYRVLHLRVRLCLVQDGEVMYHDGAASFFVETAPFDALVAVDEASQHK